MPERVIKTLDGKRGAFLLVGGLVYTLIGLSYIIVETHGRVVAFAWLPVLSPYMLGWVWLLLGVSVAVFALVSRSHTRLEPFAFGALMVCPVPNALIFGAASIIGASRTGWISATLYALIILWVWIVAGWENPRPTRAVIRRLRGTGDE